MKKVVSLALSLLFILTLFAGCGDKIVLTEDNVKELFTPTLEAELYRYGSAFYSVEKNEKGQPISYSDIDGTGTLYCKINEKMTVENLLEKVSKYVTPYPIIKQAVVEINGSLYIDDEPRGYEGIYDFNSIKLEKTDGDTYYISVDEYAYPDTDADPSATPGVPNFRSKNIFTVKSVDGILQIQEKQQVYDNVSPVNNLDDGEFIGALDKFYGDVIARDGEY